MSKEYITFGGLVKEFFEAAYETMDDYHKAESEEDRARIRKEIHDEATDIFDTICKEIHEVSDYIDKRLDELEEENGGLGEEIADTLETRNILSKIFNTDIKNSPKWKVKAPVPGDHIRVERLGGLYYHHGIFIGNDQVIHFTTQHGGEIINWKDAKVIQSSLDDFLKDGCVECRQYSLEETKELYSPEQIIANAKACIGYSNYNLIFNNCEHFAYSCTMGKHRSPQIEDLIHSLTV